MAAMENNDTNSLIREIYAEVREIKTKLESDYRALYGNGHPGLLDRVSKLALELEKLLARTRWYKEWGGRIGWLCTFGLGVYELFFRK